MSSSITNSINNNYPTVTIRSSTKEDINTICKLFRDIKSYHKCDPDDINRENILKYGFDAHPLFQIDLAEVDNKIVGFAVHYLTYSKSGPALCIEDLYIQENYRKKGVGTAYSKHLASHALKSHCKSIFFAVAEKDINEEHHLYLKKLEHYCKLIGGEKTPLFRMNRKEMDKLASSPDHASLTFRAANENDIPTICQLFSNQEEGSKIKEEAIRQDGFGAQPLFQTEFALIDKKVVGMMTYTLGFSGFASAPELFIGTFYVDPNYKEGSIEAGLLKKIAEFSISSGSCRTYWIGTTETLAATNYFDTMGGRPNKKVVGYRFPVSDDLLKSFAEGKKPVFHESKDQSK